MEYDTVDGTDVRAYIAQSDGISCDERGSSRDEILLSVALRASAENLYATGRSCRSPTGGW